MALGGVSYSDGNATTLTKTYTPSTGLLTVRFCRGFSGGFVNGTEFNLYFIG